MGIESDLFKSGYDESEIDDYFDAVAASERREADNLRQATGGDRRKISTAARQLGLTLERAQYLAAEYWV